MLIKVLFTIIYEYIYIDRHSPDHNNGSFLLLGEENNNGSLILVERTIIVLFTTIMVAFLCRF